MSNKETQVAKRSKMEILKGTLRAPSVQEQFDRVLRDNSETFIASLIDLYGSDNYLQNCQPNDVAKEALKAASLKLPISKGLGFAYLVPRKISGKHYPQFQIGYKGYIQLAMRTGQYKVINADVVYEGEIKDREKLSGHIDLSGEKKSDKVIGYFAHFELLNGFSKTLYMTKDEVTAHAKRYSQSYNYKSSAWQTNFNEMALKTLLRNLLSHYGYLSIEMISAFEKDVEEAEVQRNQEIQEKANSQELKFEDVEYEEAETAGEEKEEETKDKGKSKKDEGEDKKQEKKEEEGEADPGF